MIINLLDAQKNNKIIGTFIIIYLFIISILQVVINSKSDNYVCVGLMLIFGILATYYIFFLYNLLNYPISSLLIFGYSLYYFYLPPFATIIENKPVTNNLKLPFETYFHASLFLVSLIVFHSIYKKITKINNKIALWKYYFKFCHVYSKISIEQIVIITLISILSLGFSLILKENNEVNEVLKALQGMSYFVFFPYILSMPELFNVPKTKHKTVILVAYTFFILILGTLLNGRSFVFLGISSLMILHFFNYIFGNKSLNIRSFFSKRILFSLIIGVSLIEPVTKLSLSFVLARGIRNDVSAVELFKETIYQYNSIDNTNYIIELLKDVEENNEWDEYYVTNPFLSRLCNLKYTDNILVMSSSLNSEDKNAYKVIEFQKVLSILPLPVLKLFGSQVDKEELTSGSSGDFLFFLQTGELNTIGTFRTGSLLGSSFILFDWFYLIIIPTILIIIFIILDSLVIYKPINNYMVYIQFSPLILISLFPILFFLTSAANGSESITNIFGMVRLMIEKPLLYLFVFFISSLFPFKMFHHNLSSK